MEGSAAEHLWGAGMSWEEEVTAAISLPGRGEIVHDDD